MKFMKIGTKPDTFYTEEATRTAKITDTPNDLVVRINYIAYRLHRLWILPKSGLLQRLCSESDESDSVTVELNDMPGGADAFELCAKFCYGITINLGAHNLVSALCASKFLRMTESVDKGNLVPKLEAFFHSCILDGWKDSIVTLQSTGNLPEWSENLGIIRKCIDSIVEKILTPAAEVSWSYTYTRPGYDKRHHQSVPRDWWTEDLSDLDLDLFRCIITTVKSTFTLPPQLIGEALHVYACRWLPDLKTKCPPDSSIAENEATLERHQRIVNTIVNMIPADKGSVSAGFLLRLISIANYAGASLTTKTELIRKAGLQLEEATLGDLLLPLHSSSRHGGYDSDLVAAVLESYLLLWRRQSAELSNNDQLLRSIRRVGKLIDSYLQAVAQDIRMPVSKFVSLAEAVPSVARENHDRLYRAINIYLKDHPAINKEEKKRLCRALDCQKLSADVRAHAVKNERLPLRTVVQALFFDQDSSSKGLASQSASQDLSSKGKQTPTSEHSLVSRLHLGPAETSSKDHQKLAKAEKAMERGGERPGSNLEPKRMLQKGTGSEHAHHKTRDR
ncbi:PREDICTED: BTB/POZ domain-containing protein At5g47800 [Tarenaya hassleriana]|uniref:BTB/POZ domain-containing protein At5g47800 n=1 Tax=Tarenaya hassleriana TaxID=28532 RepID=UPI00053C63E3|nr:PREDICTED: BTB/POZ domain-containing protein At5g47800 [Tarenaya hassleriana]XP_010530085.1 PREDICTED: BTB/POZ domain-containing protein At5g47800 [Tarenaya hassleriana]XP_010530086.1 PREDICTED: BTB/POZ domain-containing protein At5g47800 [Tarenaya hassleriana]XP_010530087.1 PREDICTED: BTB/POZ domain-containing protein At5g47800 [Tarenaya hassleriana]XP_010530088.1 PREDICTED: BTB/POZ domain-containing protein At5g47800 [Tarenaya hassleriana]XP_019057270.1 PREDICTED: BTB/POZ domain-containin